MNYEDVFKLGKDIKGSYVELGFGSGHSARLMAELVKTEKISNRPIWVFDSFKGIPNPSDKDLSFDNSLKIGKFSKPIQPALDLRFDIPKTTYKVIKGYIEETLDQFTDEFISILNVDLSTYTSTKVALETLHKYVPRNGVVLVPAYGINRGVETAVDEFLAANNLTHQNKGTGYFINTPPKLEIKPKATRDETFIEKVVPVREVTEPPKFKDRYKKKPIKVIEYTNEPKKGSKVIQNKVTR